MNSRKSTEVSSTKSETKSKSINKLFGYIKKKFKNSIDDITSKTTTIENNGKTQEVVEQQPNLKKICPIPKVPRKQFHDVIVQKPLNITEQVQKLLAIQVQKCYKNIPQKYFQQSYDIGKELFSKNIKQNKQKSFQLNDFLDQIQFNTSSLVSAKQPQLLITLDNMNSMDIDIQSLLNNLKNLRKNNKRIQINLAGKAQKIKQLQAKQQSLLKISILMKNLRLLTNYPQQIKKTFAKDKLESVSLFKQYIQIHQKFKSLCGCSNNQYRKCQMITCGDYLKNSFQQSFSKSYWNYLTQGLFYQKDELKNIFGTKKDFQSMPGMAAGFSLAALLASGTLDQSICEEEKYQLIIKQNIEEQIKLLIMGGMTLFQFDNQKLLSSLSEFMQDFQKGFLSDVLYQIKQSFMMDTDGHLVSQSKASSSYSKIKNEQVFKDHKLLFQCFSVLYRVCKTLNYKKIHGKQDIEVLLGEVCYQILGFSDKYLTKLLQLRQFNKQMDFSTFRDIIEVFQDLQKFIEQIQQYFIADIASESDFIKKGMCRFANFDSLKVKLAAAHFKGLHQNSLTKQLKNGMELDQWVEVQIEPKYYNILGYILQGQKFKQDRKKMTLLNSSLFLDKKPSTSQKINFDYFQVTHQYIIIHQKKYKPTSSLLLLLEIVQKYIQINEIDENLNSQVSTKLVELLHFYNSFLFQLILNTAALHHNKIGHSITIKHLCLSYHAVGLVLALLNALKSKIQQQQSFGKLLSKMISHQQQIIKKIQSIIPYRISQQTKLMILSKPGPSKGTQNICNYLRNVNDTLKQFFQQQQIKRILNSNILTSFIQKLLKFKVKTKTQQQLIELQVSYFIIETQFLVNSMHGYQTIRSQLSNISKISKML